MSDETKIFTKNDKNGDKCASGGQESGLKLIFERGVAILVRPWRFPGQPKKFVFFSIKVGTINSGTSLDSREQFKKTGKLEMFVKLLEMLMVFVVDAFNLIITTFCKLLDAVMVPIVSSLPNLDWDWSPFFDMFGAMNRWVALDWAFNLLIAYIVFCLCVAGIKWLLGLIPTIN